VLLALYPWTPAVMKAVAYIDVRLPVMAVERIVELVRAIEGAT